LKFQNKTNSQGKKGQNLRPHWGRGGRRLKGFKFQKKGAKGNFKKNRGMKPVKWNTGAYTGEKKKKRFCGKNKKKGPVEREL